MKVVFKDKINGKNVEVSGVARVARDAKAFMVTKRIGYDEFYKYSRFTLEAIECESDDEYEEE